MALPAIHTWLKTLIRSLRQLMSACSVAWISKTSGRPRLFLWAVPNRPPKVASAGGEARALWDFPLPSGITWSEER